MTFAAAANIRKQTQRGFWLRCFLSAAMLLFASSVSSAQVEMPKPERLTHVHGIVVNPTGHPVPDLKVTLVRDDKTVAETRTGSTGAFSFDHVSAGSYIFRIARAQYAPAARDIIVTDEIVTHLERKKLYVILGPSACQDECSAVLTSRREFDRTIRKNNRH